MSEPTTPPEERKFDWVSQHDPASLNYALRRTIPAGTVTVTSKYWRAGPVIDQGAEGACVGFGWTDELTASPARAKNATVDSATRHALDTYNRAKRIDEWPGENYDGTSVLAGAKIVVQDNGMDTYHWCFSITQIRDAIITMGPVVIGIPWLDSMYETRPSGLVDTSGSEVGGHCILLTGYTPKRRLTGEPRSYELFRWRNSWGPSYGVHGGDGFVKIDDLATLLKGTGEACVPDSRHIVTL